jgi:hypothetical protein
VKQSQPCSSLYNNDSNDDDDDFNNIDIGTIPGNRPAIRDACTIWKAFADG